MKLLPLREQSEEIKEIKKQLGVAYGGWYQREETMREVCEAYSGHRSYDTRAAPGALPLPPHRCLARLPADDGAGGLLIIIDQV